MCCLHATSTTCALRSLNSQSPSYTCLSGAERRRIWRRQGHPACWAHSLMVSHSSPMTLTSRRCNCPVPPQSIIGPCEVLKYLDTVSIFRILGLWSICVLNTCASSIHAVSEVSRILYVRGRGGCLPAPTSLSSLLPAPSYGLPVIGHCNYRPVITAVITCNYSHPI